MMNTELENFVFPEITVIFFDERDVITTSGEDEGDPDEGEKV